MAELARNTPTTVQEFMDKVEEFINAKEPIKALMESKVKLEKVSEKKHKEPQIDE